MSGAARSELQQLLDDITPSLERMYGAAPNVNIVRLRGDASTRIYYRATVHAGSPKTFIVMRLPEDALKSDEGASSDRPAELPFLDVQRFLHGRGVAVPEIYATDLPRRVVLLEDLGDETFEARLVSQGRDCYRARYADAVDLLADMHRRAAEPDPSSIAFRRSFDETLLRWELEHFVEWGLVAVHGRPAADAMAHLSRHFDSLAADLAAAPKAFVHRDFQSRNLMWHDGRLVVIDFQDALLGPLPYDLVALLCDSYVAIDLELQAEMITRYAARRGLPHDAARDFETLFWKVAVQRKLKDAGRFVFIDRARGNPGFLRWYPQSLAYVGRALERTEGGAQVATILRQTIPGFADHVAVPAAVSGTVE